MTHYAAEAHYDHDWIAARVDKRAPKGRGN